MTNQKPTLGISSCLLGKKVRSNGGHKSTGCAQLCSLSTARKPLADLSDPVQLAAWAASYLSILMQNVWAPFPEHLTQYKNTL